MIEKSVISIREEAASSMPSISNPSSITWFYLSFEFVIGLGISAFLLFLTLVKSLLPKPPRDLTGEVVLVTGAASSMGGLLAAEFAREGCSVICVDEDLSAVEAIAHKLSEKYPCDIIENIGTAYNCSSSSSSRKQTAEDDEARRSRRIASSRSVGYSCDLRDREQIKRLARRVKDDVGSLDVLVTCASANSEPELFDAISSTLMSHYWAALAFLPSMLHRERARIIGITPTVSVEDAYLGSKAAIAGLMNALGQQFSGNNSRLTFMTVAPNADPKQSEKDIAREVVEAVRRDLSCITVGRISKLIYSLSCTLYDGITAVTRWLDT